MMKTAELLREKGLKVTPQRMAIYSMLEDTKSHPSAEDIYKSLITTNPTISLATVYKTLDSFKATGLIQELNIENGRSNSDAQIYPHPHILCSSCNRIYDFDANLEGVLSSMRKEIAEQTDFLINREQINFYGTCPNCRKKPILEN